MLFIFWDISNNLKRHPHHHGMSSGSFWGWSFFLRCLNIAITSTNVSAKLILGSCLVVSNSAVKSLHTRTKAEAYTHSCSGLNPLCVSFHFCTAAYFVDILDIFTLFFGALCISFSRCYSPDIRLFIYACSFSLLSLYSVYFSVFSNILSRFSRLTLRLLLLAFFGRSVSFIPAYFHLKTLAPRT